MYMYIYNNTHVLYIHPLYDKILIFDIENRYLIQYWLRYRETVVLKKEYHTNITTKWHARDKARVYAKKMSMVKTVLI